MKKKLLPLPLAIASFFDVSASVPLTQLSPTFPPRGTNQSLVQRRHAKTQLISSGVRWDLEGQQFAFCFFGSIKIMGRENV